MKVEKVDVTKKKKSNQQNFKRNNERLRKFNIVTYLSENQLKDVLLQFNCDIKGYAYIFHDKDKDEQGKKKEKHVHLMLFTYNSHTCSAIKKWFRAFDKKKKLINVLVEPMIDEQSSYEYLIHKNDKDKYQYKAIRIRKYNVHYSIYESVRDYDVFTELVLAYMENRNTNEMVLRYGRNFIVNFKNIQAVCNQINSESIDI